MVLVKFVSLTRREGTVSCPPDPYEDCYSGNQKRPRKSSKRGTAKLCRKVVEGGIGGLRFPTPDSDFT